ncbi:uncharacterized protein [Rutidosis leptorrhynchoides]|uniref:uncharacterized protein n=1 Tax=Rutidosis leptorrhynchoides TaxID=125765 RepID=UPI003A99DFAA
MPPIVSSLLITWVITKVNILHSSQVVYATLTKDFDCSCCLPPLMPLLLLQGSEIQAGTVLHPTLHLSYHKKLRHQLNKTSTATKLRKPSKLHLMNGQRKKPVKHRQNA